MPSIPLLLLRHVVGQDVALRNAEVAAAGLRERRRAHEDVEAFMTRRAQVDRVGSRVSG